MSGYREQTEALMLEIEGVRRGTPGAEGYETVDLATSRGPIEMRFYEVPGSAAAALFVGGRGGGWDTPGCGRLYPDLCSDLNASGVSALRVRYRQPNVLDECTLDVLAGLHFLGGRGISTAALVGHSFGGAVVAQAAGNSELVHAVALLSTQSQGIETIEDVNPGCAVLIAHGTADEVLPVSCSRQAFLRAREPKELRLYEGARHGLDEVSERLRHELREWILAHLPAWTGSQAIH
jgi:alpha-beta hydrolase superfamily lysophospholipase